MIRCIAMDLDDTLLDDDLTISLENRTAIQKAGQLGVKIILASGRMAQSMRPYSQELNLDQPVIAYNGALVYDVITGQALDHHPVPRELALELIPIIRGAGIHLNVYLKDELYMEELTDWGRKYAANCSVSPRLVRDLRRLVTEGPHKMLAIGTISEIERLQARLEEHFRGQLDFTRSKPNYLEILGPGVSKGSALQRLVTRWGIDRSEVIAIGDAPNDLEMITWAGIGVAMGNAVDQVKERAGFIAPDNNHHAVAEVIQRFVLSREERGAQENQLRVSSAG
ncbi:MAG: Cof-type HAD-IIB family hydrolase [Firmicutes bacterium]|nr:Cof-type HAD-IIB family hydrolase [Bacillota bacterium]